MSIFIRAIAARLQGNFWHFEENEIKIWENFSEFLQISKIPFFICGNGLYQHFCGYNQTSSNTTIHLDSSFCKDRQYPTSYCHNSPCPGYWQTTAWDTSNCQETLEECNERHSILYERTQKRKVICSEPSDEIHCSHLPKPSSTQPCETIHYLPNCTNSNFIDLSNFHWKVSKWSEIIEGSQCLNEFACDRKKIWMNRAVNCYIGEFKIDDVFCDNVSSQGKPEMVKFCHQRCGLE